MSTNAKKAVAERTPQIGEVYRIRFTGEGNVQQGERPGVVFQNNKGNAHSPNVVVLPLTTSLKKPQQVTHVFLKAKDTGLPKDSMVLCENPKCIPKKNLGRFLTRLPVRDMKRIAVGNLLASSAISFLNTKALSCVWRTACKLNASKAERF